MTDPFGRTIDYLRLSVTELCQLRCVYCMPPEGVCKRGHGEICSLEELTAIAAACVELGVKKIRLTGGEPLVRKGVLSLVEKLNALRPHGLEELCMTTNGILLPELAAPLRAAGLDRLNISLDSLRPERYRALTRGGELKRVLEGIAAAEAAGFRELRINAVLLGGVNEDELRDLALLARDKPRSVRFIELMPIGPAAGLGEAFLPAERVLEANPELQARDVRGVARYYSATGWAGTVGLIAPMSRAFCGDCSRIRVTADGRLKPCLHSPAEFPLRGLGGEALKDAIRAAVRCKPAAHGLNETGQSPAGRTMREIGG